MVCPLPHDGAFRRSSTRVGIVHQFIAADTGVPKEVNLPRPPEREIARQPVSRRGFPLVEVIEALGPLTQPELLETRATEAEVVLTRGENTVAGAVVALVGRDPD